MYFGEAERAFTSFVAYMAGVEAGLSIVEHQGDIKSYDLVPWDFHKFVTERLGHTFPVGGMGWATFITENTSSEEESFDLFLQLREEYDRAKK